MLDISSDLGKHCQPLPLSALLKGHIPAHRSTLTWAWWQAFCRTMAVEGTRVRAAAGFSGEAGSTSPPWKNVKNSAATMGHRGDTPRSQRRDVHWEHKLLVGSGNWPSTTGRGCSADLWAKGEQREASWSTQPQPSLGSVGRAVLGLCLWQRLQLQHSTIGLCMTTCLRLLASTKQQVRVKQR